MSNDDNIISINGTATASPDGIEQPARPGILIAACPIELQGGEEFFELSLREPGIIRGCAFWLKQPSVIGSMAMRSVQPVPHPLLLVEMRTDGELVRRKFFFVASDKPLAMKPGLQAQWRATAIMPAGAGHLFEVLEAST